MKKGAIISILVVVVLIGGLVWLVRMPSKPGRLDTFATCLKDSGTKFYGAFWCPHCQNQKALFGSSAKLLPYIECSPANGRGQLPVCTDAGIEGYPTWEFEDGTKMSSIMTPQQLAEKTGCEIE